MGSGSCSGGVVAEGVGDWRWGFEGGGERLTQRERRRAEG